MIQKSYDERLNEMFSDLQIDLVNFDNGNTPESMAAYVLVSNLSKKQMKNKGELALDLGNYIYRRFGIIYEMCPEYHRSGEDKNSLAFYVSKKSMERMIHVQEWILKVFNEKNEEPVKRYESALYRKRRFIIQERANGPK